MDSTGWGQGLVIGSFEYGNEPSGSTNGREFPDY
jgi:hypothetical protein